MIDERTDPTEPTISIITATFNSARTIGDTLESVASQSYPNVEHLIQDGGSTDETLQIIRSFDRHVIHLVSEPDNGIYDALNRGIARASGDVIGLLHSDDSFASPHALRWIGKAFRGHPNLNAVYANLEYVSSNNPDHVVRYWSAGHFDRRKLRNGWMPPHPTLFVRKEIFEHFGNYDQKLKISADYDAMLRWLYIHKIEAGYIDRTLVKMRLGGASNKSISSIISKSREDIVAMKNNGLNYLQALPMKYIRKLFQFRIG